MEIKINIPKNDYVQPTEVRQEVVEKICQTFINNLGDIGRYYINNDEIYLEGNRFTEFAYNHKTQKQNIRIRGVEMKASITALVKAGYYIYRQNCRKGVRYWCSKKPIDDYRLQPTTEFDTFID